MNPLISGLSFIIYTSGVQLFVSVTVLNMKFWVESLLVGIKILSKSYQVSEEYLQHNPQCHTAVSCTVSKSPHNDCIIHFCHPQGYDEGLPFSLILQS